LGFPVADRWAGTLGTKDDLGNRRTQYAYHLLVVNTAAYRQNKLSFRAAICRPVPLSS